MHERDAIHNLWKHSEKSALATVVEVKGSAYRRPGARMLLTHDGRSAGVINGGCLDGDLHARAQMVMESGVAQLACYDTTSPQDIVFGLGLGCRGVVKILIEPAHNLDWLVQDETVAVVFEGELGSRRFETEDFQHSPVIERPQIMDTVWGRAFVERLEPPQSLLIFGAGADVVSLQAMGKTLGWEVQVFDLRAPSPSRPVHVEATYVVPEQLLALEIPTGAACVIMTHNFLHDFEILKLLLPSPAAYIGLLGPRRRADELLEKLGSDTLLPGIVPTEQQLSRLFAPIGLDLGAETPEEIALSIVAEIQRVKRGKTARSLRERGSIH
jgi:xanthine/CO dehydrogenase XdhC/CoxF family maturation factor